MPLDGSPRAAGFGLKRIINDEPRAPHTGADFSAPAGAPVLAVNAGTVVLAEEHFFAGNSLVLDHGEGLFTMYFHLQESVVRPGQRVRAGEMLGRVGSTGRATGPHLHWGARLFGARIDPEELLRIATGVADGQSAEASRRRVADCQHAAQMVPSGPLNE